MLRAKIALAVGLAAVLASLVAPAQASNQSTMAPNPTGPSASTPVNPKIVKGKAGEGFFDPSAPGYATADPGTPVAQTSSMTAAVPNIAPYSTLRWATTPEDANGHPWICFGNHIGDAWQDRVIAWDVAADQLTYTYQVGSNACDGWGNNEKVDIEAGYDLNRACAYVYKAWNTAGLLTRVIVYQNRSRNNTCWNDGGTTNGLLSVRHWKSQAIGLGLGNLQFGGTLLTFNSVMDMSKISYNFPDPHRNDGLTYDYYN